MEILKKHYNDPFAGYLATKKMYNTLCHKYFWLNIYKQLDAYRISYFICQGVRVIREKQSGELLYIPIPTKL